jgi:hypothetical protein
MVLFGAGKRLTDTQPSSVYERVFPSLNMRSDDAIIARIPK